MPRLHVAQWEEIRRRRLAGEGGRELGREFGVSEAAIRQKLDPEMKRVKAVALKVVEADCELRSLPETSQSFARALIEQMQRVSVELAATATVAATTARRLAEHAGAQVSKINADDPMETQEVLQGISALTKMSNEASVVPLALLNANRDRLKAATDEPEKIVDGGSAAAERIRDRLVRLATE